MLRSVLLFAARVLSAALPLPIVLSSPVAAATLDSILLPEIKCDHRPSSGTIIQKLIRERLIFPSPFTVADSVSYFLLRDPNGSLGGLKAFAVMAHDESSKSYKFARSPGTSPGFVLGVVSFSPREDSASWAASHGRDLSIEDSMTDMPGAKDVFCTKFMND